MEDEVRWGQMNETMHGIPESTVMDIERSFPAIPHWSNQLDSIASDQRYKETPHCGSILRA